MESEEVKEAPKTRSAKKAAKPETEKENEPVQKKSAAGRKSSASSWRKSTSEVWQPPPSFIHCSQKATSIVVCLHRAEVIISDETRVVRFNRFIKCRGTFCSLPCVILPALMLLEPKQIPLNPCLPSLSLTILHSIPFTRPFARSACVRKANSSYILSLFPPSRLVWTIS